MRNQTSFRPAKLPSRLRRQHSPSAAYLKTPRLGGIQRKIDRIGNAMELAQILSALDTFTSVRKICREQENIAEATQAALGAYFDRITPPALRETQDIKLALLTDQQTYGNGFDELPPESYALIFTMDSFDTNTYSIGELAEDYEKHQPGLGRYFLNLLDECPVHIGTPGHLFEIASWFFWGGDDNEETIYQERYEEYIEMGETEEDAKELAWEYIPVTYDDFVNTYPEWTFKRELRFENKPITNVPEELKPLCRINAKLKELAVTQPQSLHHYPEIIFPFTMASWNQDAYDFGAEVIDRAVNEEYQCGVDFYLGGLYWPLEISNRQHMTDVFRSMRTVMEYLDTAMNFLQKYKIGQQPEEKAA